MKVNGRKMFVFIYLSVSAFLLSSGYMIINLILKEPLDYRVIIGFFVYELLASFGIISANTIDKYIYTVKAWRGKDEPEK